MLSCRLVVFFTTFVEINLVAVAHNSWLMAHGS